MPSKPRIDGNTIAELPIQCILKLLPSRLNPKTSSDAEMSFGFDMPDIGEQYTFTIRRGIGELATGLVGTPTMTVRGNEQDMKRIFLVGDVPPTRLEFWQRLEFNMPEEGMLTPIRKLRVLIKLSRLFLKP